jgi:predicted nucleic acid-binding protein
VVNSNLEIMMSRTILAEYDAEHNTLKLEEPLEGVEDHEKVRVAVEGENPKELSRPWTALKGCLPPETIDEIRRALAEASAPDPNEP